VQAIPLTVEKPYPVPVRLVEERVRVENQTQLLKVPIKEDRYVEVVKEKMVEAECEVLAREVEVKEIKVPCHTVSVEPKEVIVEK
jgi:hypothetical protein